MKYIKKYAITILQGQHTNPEVLVKLKLGDIVNDGQSCYADYQTEFDTEQEALEYAYKKDKWSRWVILPVIRFDLAEEQ